MGVEHTNLIDATIARVVREYGNERCRLMRREVGKFQRGPRWISVNPKGTADLEGIVLVSGIPMFFCLEVKIRPDKLKKDQLTRQRELRKLNVIYEEITDVSFEADIERFFKLVDNC